MANAVLILAAAIALSAPAAVRLPVALTYFHAPPVTLLDAARARALYAVPVVFGADIRGVRYVKSGRPDRTVATCRQYETAVRDGFGPETNFDIVMTGFLVRACGLLDAAVRARPPRRSFVDDPHVGLANIDQISSAALPLAPWEPAAPSPQAVRERQRRSVGAFVRAEHCRVQTPNPLELRIVCGDLLYSLTELLRADVDAGGTESIVVAPYMRSLSGTLADPEPVVALTRTSRRALLVPHAVPPLVEARPQPRRT